MSKNKLIVLEGIDGVGKETQLKRLSMRLRRHDHRVATLSFPRYGTPLGAFIRDMLHGKHGAVFGNDPYLVALPYALDRARAANEIRAGLKRGIVLSDRYTDSALAFGVARIASTAAQKAYMQFVEKLEYDELHIPRPTLVIYFSMSATQAAAFLRNKRGKDLNERNRAYQARVARMYAKLAKGKRWRTVQCVKNGRVRSPEDIEKEVWHIVEQHLRG